MHREEKEFQIKLAELQADIQIYLALSIGLFAALFAIAALVFQIIYTDPKFDFRIAVVGILATLEFVLLYYTIKAVEKLKVTRNELRELREKYLW